MSEISEDVIGELVRVARELPAPIRPARADNGQRYYFMFQDRELIIWQVLRHPGWSLRGISFKGGEFVAYEPFCIEGDGYREAGTLRSLWAIQP